MVQFYLVAVVNNRGFRKFHLEVTIERKTIERKTNKVYLSKVLFTNDVNFVTQSFHDNQHVKYQSVLNTLLSLL